MHFLQYLVDGLRRPEIDHNQYGLGMLFGGYLERLQTEKYDAWMCGKKLSWEKDKRLVGILFRAMDQDTVSDIAAWFDYHTPVGEVEEVSAIADELTAKTD